MQNKPNPVDIQNKISGLSLDTELGMGGFKVVHRGTYNGATEAIKIAHIPEDPDDPTVKEENSKRLVREISLLGKCQNAALVKLGSLSPTEINVNSNTYMVYSEELLSGRSLRDLINTGASPGISEMAKLGLACIGVIEELWQSSVIHRDIKPDNIISTGDSTRPFVLLDLGVAYVVGGTGLTGDQSRIPGTRYYLAPEMLMTDFRDNLDFRCPFGERA